MSYGLQCFDVNGTKVFDTETAATRIVWQKTVVAGASSNETVPEIDGKTIGVVSYSIEQDSGGNIAHVGGVHTVTRAGTTITWTSKGTATYCPSVDTKILVFLFD
jgi:hypothetical protein